jgi:hypothetical protein
MVREVGFLWLLVWVSADTVSLYVITRKAKRNVTVWDLSQMKTIDYVVIIPMLIEADFVWMKTASADVYNCTVFSVDNLF